MAKFRPPVKYHGGKFYLSDWIVDNFPSNYELLTYVEVFVGGGSVLLNKRPSVKEVANDGDYHIMALWRTIKNSIDELSDGLMKWPYTEESFISAKNLLAERDKEGFCSDGETAILEYIVRRMSRGGMRKAFAWSERLRGGKPGDLNAWETSLDNLWKISDRVKRVKMLNLDFREIFAIWDDHNDLLYLDPPYMKDTRAKGSTEIYSLEMSDKDHGEMLDLCLDSNAKIIISGYQSSLYEGKLSNWNKVYKDIPNHSAQGKSKSIKREILWKNY